MAGIGDDIKEVLQELGTPFTIYRASKTDELVESVNESVVINCSTSGITISGQYLDLDESKERRIDVLGRLSFIGNTHYDSLVDFGDIISFMGKKHLVFDVKRNMFENTPVDTFLLFLECNVAGRFARAKEVRDVQTYQTTVQWQDRFCGVDAVQIEKDAVIAPVEFNDQINLSLNNSTLFCQNFDVRVGDRWYPTNNTDCYLVVSVNKYQYSNIIVCGLEEDSR